MWSTGDLFLRHLKVGVCYNGIEGFQWLLPSNVGCEEGKGSSYYNYIIACRLYKLVGMVQT